METEKTETDETQQTDEPEKTNETAEAQQHGEENKQAESEKDLDCPSETNEASRKNAKILKAVVAVAVIFVLGISALAFYNAPERALPRFISRADEAYDAENYAQAARYYEKALKIASDDTHCLLFAAESYYADENEESAAAAYEKLFALVHFKDDEAGFKKNYEKAYKKYLALTDCEVTFTDAEVEKNIRAYLKKPHGKIMRSELDNIKAVFALGKEWYIFSEGEELKEPPLPEGIAYGDGKVTSTADFSLFTSLEFVRLSGQKLKAVEGDFSALMYLDVFDVSYNEITDISAVATLYQTERLYLQHNVIENIEAVGSLTRLKTLYLSFNKISDITPVSNLTGLNGIGLTDNNLYDISALAPLTELTGAGLAINHISDITPLENMTKLTGLGLDYNDITDVSPLSKLTKLVDLGLRDNDIQDVAPLLKLVSLQTVDLTGNGVTEEDAEKLLELKNIREVYTDGGTLRKE